MHFYGGLWSPNLRYRVTDSLISTQNELFSPVTQPVTQLFVRYR
jgi:hypothetical protein